MNFQRLIVASVILGYPLTILVLLIEWLGFFYVFAGIFVIFGAVKIVRILMAIARDLQSDGEQPPASAQSFLERVTPRDWRETVSLEYWDLYASHYERAKTKCAVLAVKLSYYLRVIDTVPGFVPVHIRNWISNWINDWVFPPAPVISAAQVVAPETGDHIQFVSKRAAAAAAVKKDISMYFAGGTWFGLLSAGAFYISSLPLFANHTSFIRYFGLMVLLTGAMAAFAMVAKIGFLLMLGMFEIIDSTARFLRPMQKESQHVSKQSAVSAPGDAGIFFNLFVWFCRLFGGICIFLLVLYTGLILMPLPSVAIYIFRLVMIVSFCICAVSATVIAAKVGFILLLGTLWVAEKTTGIPLAAFGDYLPQLQRWLINHSLGTRRHSAPSEAGSEAPAGDS